MTNTMKKAISLLLAVVQLFVLFPVLQPQAEAAQSGQETPVLNKTVVGTVKFQSFNFLGDNVNGVDGTDYKTTFYYSDDYFAPSAINSGADKRAMLWSDLDNKALATCSMDFAVAAMTSATDDVLRATSETWNNSKYDRWIQEDGYVGFVKEQNVRDFLSACGFSGIECTELNKRPTNDSIGYTLASKDITVWNADSQKNETYTLIAVGVRGAGYGQEWASNISIGDPATGAMPASGRHWGFEDGAQKVCGAISTYLRQHNISGQVKYWVTGFSRAAAVANLVAGYLTDEGGTYKTQPKDVYGYTWECPQAAKKTDSPDTNFTNYKNIHNILNPMDAVPKVSPDAFEHQRLGVDYQMPYHGNANPTLNDSLYKQMYQVLKTIAVGNGIKTDPLVNDPDSSGDDDGYVSPAKYPYNKPMTIYTVNATKLMTQAIGYAAGSDTLMKEFGTEQAEHKHKEGWLIQTTRGNVEKLLGWDGGSDYKTSTWYIDKFIDELVKVFLTSDAWVGRVGTSRTALENRATFISEFQPHFRTLFGYFLDYAGPAFLDLIPNLIGAVSRNIGSTLLSEFPADFILFYASPTNTTIRNRLIQNAKPIVHNVIDELTAVGSGFPDPEYQNITKQQAKDAMDALVPLVIDLYAFEKSYYDSQYLGTTLRYLWTILCTHEQETVLSWIMSLDPNHMNRSCRLITLPAGCDAEVYEYREQYAQYEGSVDDVVSAAPKVAELKNGNLSTLDERITLYRDNGNYVIRYPASLKIRVDVKPTQTLNLNQVSVDDYETINAYTAVSAGESQFQNKPLASTYNSITTRSAWTNAAAKNTSMSNYGTIDAGDTLHVIVNDMKTYNSRNTAYDLIVDKAPIVTVQDYASCSLTSGTEASSAVELGGSQTVTTSDNSRTILTRTSRVTVPASSIYYDDELTGNSAAGYNAATTRLDWNDETGESVGKLIWYQFRGTRIDLYCTTDDTTGYIQAAVYRNNNGEVGDRVDRVTMKSASDTPRYNVPTISFDGLDPNTDYYLKINALKGSNYRLDGIRVYHAADESDSAVRSAYAAAGEQNANYVNLRALLLGTVTEETVDSTTAASALFYTDSGTSYELASSEYQTNSPKNEIYLKTGEKVAFQIVGEYEKVAVGLSAPESKTGGGIVKMTNGSATKNETISGPLDQYYSIQPASNGSVVIENTGAAMIAVTNVKLSGEYTPPAIVESVGPLRASKSLMRYAADFAQLPAAEETEATPEPTPEPTPEVTPEPTPGISDAIRQLISSFVSSLFGSISRLFGN